MRLRPVTIPLIEPLKMFGRTAYKFLSPKEVVGSMAEAVIFDMDGVISDTQDFHAKVEGELLKEYGVDMPAEGITTKYVGYSDDEFYETVLKEHGITRVGIEEATKEIWKRKFAAAKGNITPIPGAIELIGALKDSGFKLAIASASIPEFVETVVTELGIADSFDAITSSVEVENGKPEPDPFLLAANKMGAKPSDCVVIEDGRDGMVAAKKAGMKCIGLVKDDDNYPADVVVKSLTEVTVETIREI